MIIKRVSTLCFFLVALTETPSFCQFNIKVGYSGAYTNDIEINNIISTFNNNYGQKLEDDMDPFTSMHGLTIGLRYKIKSFGMELSWQSLSGKSDFIGDIVNGNVNVPNVSDKWFFSDTDYSLGLENYFGRFGYGASFGLGTLRMKTDIVGSSRKKRTVMSETSPLGRIYVLFEYPGDKVSASIRPYVQFPIGQGYNTFAFENDLITTYDPSVTLIDGTYQKSMIFGLTFALYNGPSE
jgi:hypothetical protein